MSTNDKIYYIDSGNDKTDARKGKDDEFKLTLKTPFKYCFEFQIWYSTACVDLNLQLKYAAWLANL